MRNTARHPKLRAYPTSGRLWYGISCTAFAWLLGFGLAFADDWPTHLHDNYRSGRSNETLKLPLALHWSHELPQPKPAWPLPAKQDYWHRKTNLRPRIVHDRAHGLVVSDGRVFTNSSADDQIRSLDAATGELRWRTFAEAPIRLAPSVWSAKNSSPDEAVVVFAADDGYAYGASVVDGSLRWKTRPKQVENRRIPGNGRIISDRPIRSGVMIKPDGTGYFAAGIFPLQGAFFFSIDTRSGAVLDHAKIEKSIQGYLEIRDGKVFAPTGRDPHGVTVKSVTDDLGAASKLKSTKKLDDTSYTVISDQANTYYGRENEVVAMCDGKQVWSAKVNGRVYTMAISDGRLFVSTDQGIIYAFGTQTAAASPRVWQDLPTNEDASPDFALFVDPSNEDLKALIRSRERATSRIVVAVETDSRATEVRNELQTNGSARHAAVHVVDSIQRLPYGSHIFHYVWARDIEPSKQHVRPYDGMAESPAHRFSAPALNNASWTHAYGGPENKASSAAKVGGQRMRLQWFGGPGPRHMVDRHMRTMPPLVSHGYMFVPGLDRVIAVDAFNGTILWEHEIPGMTRIGMLKDCGWMAARDDQLFVAVENKLLRLETQKGHFNEDVAFEMPLADRDWGYLACVGDTIVGSSTLKGAHRKTINRQAILEGAYSDNRPIVCSDGLFAFHDDSESNATEKRLKWKYKSPGAILNPTIAAVKGIEPKQSRLYFVENEMGDLEATSIGRVTLEDFLEQRARLVAFNLETGEREWMVHLPPIPGAQNAFVSCDAKRVVVVNSRNAGTVHYDVRVFDARNDTELWSATQDNQKRLGGDHGEQDKHPVIVGDRLVVEPLAYDLDTGSKLTELNLSKRGYGCGTLSASADAIFFRSGNPARYSLETNKLELVTAVTRPSCWINMIPAENMLLIPEGSSGCTCNFAVQTSMAFIAE